MSEEQQIKELCLTKAVAELELLLNIIGDLGYLGYKVSRCRLKGHSYGKCARKLNVSKSLAQHYWETCQRKGYDLHLKKMFNL